mgnify:CR=1
MPRNNMEIAQRIRGLVKARGTTVKRTLEECGINRNFLYDLEHSDSSPSVDKITRIAGYFDVSSAWLLAGEEDGAEAFLRLYRQLSEPDREKLRAYMCALLGEER